MDNNIVTFPTDLSIKMSSREIAEIMGKRHDNVIADIKKLIKDEAINALNFQAVKYTDAKGEKRPMYLLDFIATMTLVTGYDAVRRAKVIDRWKQLETGEAEPAYVQQEQVKHNQKPDTLTKITKEMRNAIALAKMVGLDKNQAILSADRLVKDMTGSAPLQLLGITHLIAEKQEIHMTPTEIGKQLGGLSAIKTNKLLEKKGLQESYKNTKEKLCWKPTDKGKEFVILKDTNKKSGGTPILQMFWLETVMPILKAKKFNQLNIESV